MLFEDDTERQVKAFAKNLPHALLLVGEAGAGLATTAKYLAGGMLAGIIEPITAPDSKSSKKAIRIDQIRDLQTYTRGITKTTAVYIIDDADLMTHQAQNAFLKLLEEPNPNIHFILTSHHPGALLSTVLSRVEKLHIKPISQKASQLLLSKKSNLDATMRSQIIFLAEGKPALIERLARDESSLRDIGNTIKDVQLFLSGNFRDKLVAIAKYKDREAALDFLRYTILLLQKTLHTQQTQQALQTLDRAAIAYDHVKANGNVKLHLLTLLL